MNIPVLGTHVACKGCCSCGQQRMADARTHAQRTHNTHRLAYASRNQVLGYCQSMNFIAAFFLLYLNANEEQTFWLLAACVERLAPDYYLSTMEGLQVGATRILVAGLPMPGRLVACPCLLLPACVLASSCFLHTPQWARKDVKSSREKYQHNSDPSVRAGVYFLSCCAPTTLRRSSRFCTTRVPNVFPH